MKNSLLKTAWLCLVFLCTISTQVSAQLANWGNQNTQQGFCPPENEIAFQLNWAENFGLGGALFWTITKDGESEPEYTGQYGYYAYNVPNYTEDFFQTYCLDGGCYTIAFSEAGFGDEITADAPLLITNGNQTNLVDPLTGDLDGFSFQFCTSIDGCTDETACNYSPEATQNDGSCVFTEGEFSFACPDDIELEIGLEENAIAHVYDLPTLTGSCEELDFGMNSMDGFFAQNVPNYLDLLGNTYIFNYDSQNQISDGGQDMYDGGNQLWTNSSSNYLDYTGGAVLANADFGPNGRYITSEQTGMFLLAADLDGIESFRTTGNLGADGNGSTSTLDLTSGDFNGFYKQVCSAGDPSINQLIIVDASVSASQTASNNTNDGLHTVSGLNSATRLVYLMWAGASGYCYSQEEVQVLLDEAVLLMDLITDGNTVLTQGLYPGGSFPLGTTTVAYAFTDEEETVHECSFEVNVIHPNAGCTDQFACNYDAEATQNDGSCEYPDFGFDCNGDCLGDAVSTSDLLNQTYWGIAFIDCFSGEEELIPEAVSFNSNGNIDLFLLDEFGNISPNSEAPFDLEYEVFGNCLVSIDNMPGLYLDGSVIVESKGCLEFFPLTEGCNNEDACNYDPELDINNDDLCDFACYGCMDENACNFDAEATLSDSDLCEYTFDFELVEFLNNEEPPLVGNNDFVGAEPMGMVFIYEADNNELVTNFTFSLIEEDVNFYACLADGCYYMTFDYPEEYEGLEFDMDFGEDTDEDLDGYLNDQQYYFTFGETDCVGGCFDPAADNYYPNATFDNEQCVYNDNCDSAIELILNGEPIVGINTGATGLWAEDNCLEVDEDDPSLVNSVWYSLTVPHGPFVIRTILDGTMNDSSMDVYLNCSLNSIVDCNDDDEDLESALYFECDAFETGSTIYVRIDGYDDSVGSFSIVAESLEWEEDLEGCTNPMADNYEACANLDDASCIITGCTDQSACNFNVLANNAGACDYESCAGCTDPLACNYDDEAIIFDFELCNYSFVFESGEFIPVGVQGQEELGFATIYSLDDAFVSEFPVYQDIYTLQGLCIEPGCYYVEFDLPIGFNSDFTIALDGGEDIVANFNDQERFYFSFGTETCPAGCMDEQADNYDFFAVIDDGTCLYNDFCISAEALFIDDEPLMGDNTNAGGSLNEADCFDDDDVVNSVWYVLEVPEGAFQISTMLNGSMDDSMMEIYESCSATESIACNDDDEDLESSISFDCGDLTPGDFLYIRIDGYDESMGTFFIFAESMDEVVVGCTDENAANYDACANTDDNSCEFEGCTDETAVNYDETATIDDGSCNFEGCTDATAANYDENASTDDGSCEYEGCTDENALNYDENASIDDGSCEYNCFEPTVLYELDGCNDNEDGFSINLGVLNTEISGPFIISNNLNDEELLVTEDGDYSYGSFDEDEEVVIILTSTITPNCFVSSSILACPLSMEEAVESEWGIYPNPVSAALNVSIDPNSIELIHIYDAQGKLLESFQATQNIININTSQWSSGLYYVQVLGQGYSDTKTLIVQP